MLLRNKDIAAMFRKLADLLAVEGANSFRVRAYRQAALTIEGLAEPLQTWVREGRDLTRLPGIGEAISKKIQDIVVTGRLPLLEELSRREPAVLTDLLALPGLGPQRVEELHEALHIHSLAELEQAAREGRVRAVPGFGPKIEAAILAAIEERKTRGPERRWSIARARPVAEALLSFLRGRHPGARIEMAGSYRRRKETVGDLDMVASASPTAPLLEDFCRYCDVAQVLLHGSTRSSIVLHSGLHVDLRVVGRKSFGTTWAYFTGSRAHTIALRKRAVQAGWKLNEYALSDRSGRALAGPSEEGLYAAFGMDWIPPELREQHGELDAAREHRLPELVRLGELSGDARVSPRQVLDEQLLDAWVSQARKAGYSCLGMAPAIAAPDKPEGLSPDDLKRHLDLIESFNATQAALESPLRIFKACLFEIPASGSPLAPLADSLSDALLQRLDYVVASAPRGASPSRRERERQTQRVLQVMAQPLVRILAHPSGRSLQDERPSNLELGVLFRAAAKEAWYPEIQADPEHPDLSDIQCRLARQSGARLALSSGAQTPAEMARIEYGLWQARRGWLKARDLLRGLP